MNEILIIAAQRTPQGRFLGALADQSVVDLGLAAARAALADIDAGTVDQVIIGNVLSAGQGMNVARQVAIGAGVSVDRPAFTVNMMCGSGLQAVLLAAQAIHAGSASVVLCGGAESMSNAPYLLERARTGYKLGDGALVDSLLRDGLVDTFAGEHMALLAEKLARRFDIGRRSQDEFALHSQQSWRKAAAAGRFDAELTPVKGVTADEHPRPDTTLDGLTKLKPAFLEGGTVTPGNASGINDGAAMLVVCSRQAAEQHDWSPLASVRAGATVGCDPQLMGLGPVYATEKVCQQLGLGLEDFDLIEINEAFAAQVLACCRELELDPERVNLDGGAIALGHPIGASGARLLVHLTHRLAAGTGERGLVALCIGGGMGIAAVVESCRAAQ